MYSAGVTNEVGPLTYSFWNSEPPIGGGAGLEGETNIVAAHMVARTRGLNKRLSQRKSLESESTAKGNKVGGKLGGHCEPTGVAGGLFNYYRFNVPSVSLSHSPNNSRNRFYPHPEVSHDVTHPHLKQP